MAENNDNNSNNGNGSATTVLISVIIVVLIGVAFYFGFARGHWGNNDRDGGVNIELNTPGGGSEGGVGEY